MMIDHDVHVHTHLSACCHDPAATPAAILARAREHGLRLIGFADHFWDETRPGASSWYAPQNLAHVESIREELGTVPADLQVLIGCESEFGGPELVGIGAAAASRFDFVLLPMSHLHMKGFIIEAEIREPREVAELMVTRFLQLVDLGLATGVAHPFLPCGFPADTDAIVGAISDAVFRRCFEAAAAAGVSIEITTGFFPSLRGDGAPIDGWSDDVFLRPLSLARDAGCFFHFASDTHTLAGVGGVLALEPYVRELGLTREHIHPCFRNSE